MKENKNSDLTFPSLQRLTVPGCRQGELMGYNNFHFFREGGLEIETT